MKRRALAEALIEIAVGRLPGYAREPGGPGPRTKIGVGRNLRPAPAVGG